MDNEHFDPKMLQKTLKNMTRPLLFPLAAFAKMPLGFFAGLKVDFIDEDECAVSLPGGWRTQNPFQSTYWAAQGMAAEMATGLHPYAYASGCNIPVRMILAATEARFGRQCKTRAVFRCRGGDPVRTAFAETLKTGQSVSCPIEVIGEDRLGEVVSEWTFTWSLRAKLPA